MNVLPGKIEEVITEGDLSLVKIEVKGTPFKSIVVEKPQTASYLRAGHKVNVLFKETEVIIGRPFTEAISLQNRMLCQIHQINQGKLLSELRLSFRGLPLTAIITSGAVDQLSLQTGDEVLAMVKTNEVMLSPL